MEPRLTVLTVWSIRVEAAICDTSPPGGHFSSGSPASFSFSVPAKIGLIDLYLASKKLTIIAHVGQDGHPEHGQGLQDRRVAQVHLLRDLSGRQLQLEKFDDPQPLPAADAQFIYLTTGEVVKIVSALFTPMPPAPDSRDLIAVATDAETAVVFPTPTDQITLRCILSPDNMFEARNAHAPTLNKWETFYNHLN